MNFEPVITIGNLLEMGAVVLGGIGALYALRGEIKYLGLRMKNVEKAVDTHSTKLDQLGELIAKQGRTEERINFIERRTDERIAALERRQEEMSHGEGYVLPIVRSAYER